MKRKRAHAGYSREEWRRIRATLPADTRRAPLPPRTTAEILSDFTFQLETLWQRFPREFWK